MEIWTRRDPNAIVISVYELSLQHTSRPTIPILGHSLLQKLKAT